MRLLARVLVLVTGVGAFVVTGASAASAQEGEEIGNVEISFDVGDFHLYVHEGELGWQSSRSFPLHRDN